MQDDEKEFRFLLQQLISYLHNCEPHCNRICEWASCFRAKTVVNTNMFVESFHRTLKIVYLRQKQNRRIDLLLHTLLKFAKDKVFDQLTKLEKGKFSHSVSEINKRHVKATKMARDLTKRDETTWIVPSETDPEAS